MQLQNLINPNQIISFLNKPILVDSIILAMVVFSTIVIFILFYHWDKYQSKNVVRLESDEKIIEVFRKHWFVFLVNLMFFLILAVIPLAVFYLPINLIDWFSQIQSLLSILYIAWLDFIFFGILIRGTNYFLDIWILTNKRI